MDEKGIALTMLGIIAVIAIVGLVLMFTKGTTGEATAGTCWSAGGHMQCTPDAACKRMYGEAAVKVEIEKGADPYEQTAGVNQVLCKIPTGYTAPNDYEYKWAPILQKI